jgi:hypothetical protein
MKGYKRYIIGLLIIIYGAYLTKPDLYYFNEMNRAASLPKNTLDPEEPSEPEMPSHYLNHFTLTGIDSNDNGVRDDVDIWINRVGKTYNERMALRENAKSLTKQMIACDNNDSESVSSLVQKISRERDCISFVILSKTGEEIIWESLFNVVRNNNKRSCYSFYRHNSSTSMIKGENDLSITCSFKIRNIEIMKSRYEDWRKKQ